MFVQQRIQIMHIAKHHDEYTDAYLYAWEASVYPLFSDTDGSVPSMPHEPYSDFFKIPKQKVKFLLKRFDDACDKEENLTFYKLEDELSIRSGTTGWERTDLLHICRYFYLEKSFNNNFWNILITPKEHPIEAESINRNFDRNQDIYFM